MVTTGTAWAREAVRTLAGQPTPRARQNPGPPRPDSHPGTGRSGVRGLPHVPALDGVRAFAVLSVIGYHAGVGALPGGLLGVDVFFVLSGFLITSLLLSEWTVSGRIDLARFWMRRARRLLPALLLVLLAVAVYGLVAAPPEQQAALRGDGLSTLVYVANWHFAFTGQGYFDLFAAPSPLLHMWSLAVEEQFYLLWPLIAILVLRRARTGRLMLGRVALVGAVSSAALMAVLHASGTDTSSLYYGTHTRAAPLLIGAALATARPAGLRATGHRARTALQMSGGLGAVVVLWCFGNVDGRSPGLYNGGFLLLAVAVAAVLASVSGVPEGALARGLSWSPLRAIGTISYGLYLWHWPVVLVLTRASTGLSGLALLALRLAITFAVATLSYVLVERPIRTGTWRLPRPRLAVPAVIAGVCAVVVVGTAGPATPSPLKSIMSGSGTDLTGADVRMPGATPPVQPVAPPVTAGAPRRVGVALFGDSVAFTLAWTMWEGSGTTPYGVDLQDLGVLGCGVARGGPIRTDGVAVAENSDCPNWPQLRSAQIRQYHPDVAALLIGRWEVHDRVHDGLWMHVGQPEFDRYVTGELEQAVAVLGSGGATVALLTTPCFAGRERSDGGTWPENDPSRVTRLNELIHDVAARHPGKVEVVDLYGMLCPGGQYEQQLDGVTVRRADGVHIQPGSGAWLQSRLLPILHQIGERHLQPAKAP